MPYWKIPDSFCITTTPEPPTGDDGDGSSEAGKIKVGDWVRVKSRLGQYGYDIYLSSERPAHQMYASQVVKVPAPSDAPKKRRPTVGDRVKCVNPLSNHRKDVEFIIMRDDHDRAPYCDGKGLFYAECEVELVDAHSVATPKSDELKVGDHVERIHYHNGPHGNIGSVGEITQIYKDSCDVDFADKKKTVHNFENLLKTDKTVTNADGTTPNKPKDRPFKVGDRVRITNLMEIDGKSYPRILSEMKATIGDVDTILSIYEERIELPRFFYHPDWLEHAD